MMRHLRDVRSHRSFLKRVSIFAAIAALLAQPLALLPISTVFAAPIINEVMADPVTIADAEGEWVELKNDSTEAVDISGWKIAGATIPANSTIAGSGLFVLCKTSTATTVCNAVASSLNLVNSGTQTITLSNSEDQPVDTFSYTGSTSGNSIEVIREDSSVTGATNSTDSYATNQTTPNSDNTGTPGAENRTLPSNAVVNISTGEHFTTLQAAINDSDTVSGNTISINEDLTVGSQTTVSKSIIINGNGHTLSPTFTKTSNSNNAAIGVIGTNSVIVTDLIIDGSGGTDLHGINLYEAADIQLNGLIIRDNDHYAVVVNSSSVTIDSITTSGNGWGGVNVDKVTMAAQATMTGVNSHDEQNALYVEGEGASMTDDTSTSQYYEYPAGSGVYHTKQSDFGVIMNTTTKKTYDTLQAVLSDNATTNGDNIKLAADLVTSQQITVTKAVTIDGQGFSIAAEFTKSSNTNNAVIGVQVSGVTIKNITINAGGGATQMLHGINIYEADDVLIENVTALNGRSGVVVGQGSTVTINGITTSGNIWHGVNVDKAGSYLEITGTNSHDEARPIYVDNKDVGTVVDSDEQYTIFEEGNAWTYVLTDSLQNEDGSIMLPANNGQAVTPLEYDIVLESSNADASVFIPAGSTITANSTDWDGTILPPTYSSYVIPGEFTTGLAITVGSTEYTLTFDKPVLIVLAGQAGKRAGFVPAGSTIFSEITTLCNSDDVFELDGANECVFNEGDDLYIVTNHFTTFLAYENSAQDIDTDDSESLAPLEQISDEETAEVGTVSYTGTPSPTVFAVNDGKSDDGDVLGTSDKVTSDTDPTPVVEPSEEGWKLFGLAWYWWVIIIGALGAAGWVGTNWYRGRSDA